MQCRGVDQPLEVERVLARDFNKAPVPARGAAFGTDAAEKMCAVICPDNDFSAAATVGAVCRQTDIFINDSACGACNDRIFTMCITTNQNRTAACASGVYLGAAGQREFVPGQRDMPTRKVRIFGGKAGVVDSDVAAQACCDQANASIWIGLYPCCANGAVGIDGKGAQVVVDRSQLNLCRFKRARNTELPGFTHGGTDCKLSIRQRDITGCNQLQAGCRLQLRTGSNLRLGRNHDDVSTTAFDCAEDLNATGRIAAEVERASRHKSTVAQVLGACYKAAVDINHAIPANHNPILVDQKDPAIAQETAIDVAGQTAHDPIQGRAVGAGGVDAHCLTRTYTEALPVDDGPVAALLDGRQRGTLRDSSSTTHYSPAHGGGIGLLNEPEQAKGC